LNELFDRAVMEELHGRVSVEIVFHGGKPVTASRSLTGQDK